MKTESLARDISGSDISRAQRSFSVAFNPAYQRCYYCLQFKHTLTAGSRLFSPRWNIRAAVSRNRNQRRGSLFLAFVKHRPNLCFMRSDSVTSVNETLSDYNQNTSCGSLAFDSIKIARGSYYQDWLIIFPIFFCGSRCLLQSSRSFYSGRGSKQFYIIRSFVKFKRLKRFVSSEQNSM